MFEIVDLREQMAENERKYQRERLEGLNAMREKLDAAFTALHGDNHWKDPIDTVIFRGEFDLMAQACDFFTATKLTIAEELDDERIRVTAIGYRAGPAGDH